MVMAPEQQPYNLKEVSFKAACPSSGLWAPRTFQVSWMCTCRAFSSLATVCSWMGAIVVVGERSGSREELEWNEAKTKESDQFRGRSLLSCLGLK